MTNNFLTILWNISELFTELVRKQGENSQKLELFVQINPQAYEYSVCPTHFQVTATIDVVIQPHHVDAWFIQQVTFVAFSSLE